MRFLSAFVALALVALLAALAWLLRPQDEAWARLQAGGSLRIAMDPSFPPFDMVDEKGQIAGFDADLAQELAARLHAPVEFKAIAFDGLVDAVLADKVDLVISAFPLDPRLTQDVRYSRPYFEAGLVLVSRPEDAVSEPEALTDRVIAVEWGSLGDAWARERALPIMRTETPADALKAVASGAADFAVVDAVTAALNSPAELIIHSPPLESDPYVIVSSLHAPKLAEAIDEALLEILSDGTWERLTRAYFPMPPLPPSLTP
ncbi:MAG: amino acid ABC transporter substrate-binding protein [Chloroflexi bacterium]|nr:amino acid ABC transporter substrate-binding protein [Chloroflexota bacterium]